MRELIHFILPLIIFMSFNTLLFSTGLRQDDGGFIPLDQALNAADNAAVPLEEYLKLSAQFQELSTAKVKAEHMAREAEAETIRQADKHKSIQENLINRCLVCRLKNHK